MCIHAFHRGKWGWTGFQRGINPRFLHLYFLIFGSAAYFSDSICQRELAQLTRQKYEHFSNHRQKCDCFFAFSSLIFEKTILLPSTTPVLTGTKEVLGGNIPRCKGQKLRFRPKDNAPKFDLAHGRGCCPQSVATLALCYDVLPPQGATVRTAAFGSAR